MTNHSLAVSTLIIGQPTQTEERAHALLQQALCPKNGCGSCTSCHMIRTHKHHHLLWLAPEKKYTLEDLEPISHTIGFTLELTDHFFFVLEKAELLTTACANSLLKLVEEPAPGYHFLFLAHQAHLVLPTIRSRCHILYTQPTDRKISIPFLRHFMETSTSAASFLKDLQTDSPEDHEVPVCIDILLQHWIKYSMQALGSNDPQTLLQARSMIALLEETTRSLPMPGSAKIFWRNLFLRKEQYENA